MGKKQKNEKKIIACEIFQRNIEYLSRKHELQCNVVYIPQESHNNKKLLSDRISEAVKQTDREMKDGGSIALAFGLCGSAVEGLRTENAQLLLLKAHDCFSAMLGEKRYKGLQGSEYGGSYFLSRDWVEKTPIFAEEKYPGADSNIIEAEKELMKNYSHLIYVQVEENEADGSAAEKKARRFASEIGLNFQKEYGSNAALEYLLLFNSESKNIAVYRPGERVNMENFLKKFD